MSRYSASLSSTGQAGYAVFGVSRDPQDQPAIDAMAGNFFNKRKLNNLSAVLGTSIRDLRFDSDEAAQLLSHPNALPDAATILAGASDSNMVAQLRFYEYAMNIDYVCAWIRNLSTQIDYLASNSSPVAIAGLAKHILRTDYAEWDWKYKPAVVGGAVARTATDPWLVDSVDTVQSLEPQNPQRPANYYRGGARAITDDLAEHPLVSDILILAVGLARPSLAQLDGAPTRIKVAATESNASYTGVIIPMMIAYAGPLGGVQTELQDAAMSSGLRDYLGGMYADLMQKFWVALKNSGLIFGSTPATWTKSLDQGPLLGRRFHSCKDGEVPVFFNKYGDSIPPAEAITWRRGKPFINDGVVEMSRGGCTPAISADIDSRSRYGAPMLANAWDPLGRAKVSQRAKLPFNTFDANAMLIDSRPKATHAAKTHKKRKAHKISAKKPAKKIKKAKKKHTTKRRRV